MEIVYNGPAGDGVTIAATGQHAPFGVVVDVPEDVAAELLEQNVWSIPTALPTRAELVAIAKAAGLSATGTRDQLAERIRATAAAVTTALTINVPVTGEEEHPDVAA